jgi:hypothetical protein
MRLLPHRQLRTCSSNLSCQLSDACIGMRQLLLQLLHLPLCLQYLLLLLLLLLWQCVVVLLGFLLLLLLLLLPAQCFLSSRQLLLRAAELLLALC